MFEYLRIVESVPKIDLYAPGGVHKEFPKAREKDALTEILNGMDASIEVLQYEETSYTGKRYGMEKYYPTWKIEENHPLVAGATEVFTTLFGQKPVVDKWTFSTNGVTINGYYKIPCIGFGPGNEVLAHAPNEKVPVKDLVVASAFYAGLAFSI